MEAIEDEPDKSLKDFLKIAFSSMVHLCSRMIAVSNPSARAGVFAGLEFEKIHHQPLGQVSAKAMMQPFGSAQGDFYLKFYKPSQKSKVSHPEEIDVLIR